MKKEKAIQQRQFTKENEDEVETSEIEHQGGVFQIHASNKNAAIF